MFELNLINTGLKTISVLFLVLSLLILVLYIMKRFLFLRRGLKKDRFVKILSSLHLSPKERIEVIEISGERIVLGVTPNNISFLTKLGNIHGEKREIHGNKRDHEIEE